MWPLPLAIGVFLAPESPWWLVRKGRLDDAKKALLRLTSLNRETDFDADETVAMMVHTTALEEKITSGASYFDCELAHPNSPSLGVVYIYALCKHLTDSAIL